MFDAVTPLQVVASVAGVFIAGYGAGLARAYVRRLLFAS